MRKSLKRVHAALIVNDLPDTIIETGQATTAQMAAKEIRCVVDQIVKSIIFLGKTSEHCILFLTAGSNQVDVAKASKLVGEPFGQSRSDGDPSANGICDWRGFAHQLPSEATGVFRSEIDRI